MTTILCDIDTCAYWKDGECRHEFLRIRPNGMCGELIDAHGQPRPMQEKDSVQKWYESEEY